MSEEPKFKRRKISHLRTGSDVLQSLFENGQTPLSIQFIRWKLWKKWDFFVGKTMAASSEPVGYYKGTLYIWVKSSTWMQQMVFMAETIKTTINQKLGMNYAKDIRFTLDRKSVPQDAQISQELKKSIESLMAEGDNTTTEDDSQA